MSMGVHLSQSLARKADAIQLSRRVEGEEKGKKVEPHTSIQDLSDVKEGTRKLLGKIFNGTLTEIVSKIGAGALALLRWPFSGREAHQIADSDIGKGNEQRPESDHMVEEGRLSIDTPQDVAERLLLACSGDVTRVCERYVKQVLGEPGMMQQILRVLGEDIPVNEIPAYDNHDIEILGEGGKFQTDCPLWELIARRLSVDVSYKEIAGRHTPHSSHIDQRAAFLICEALRTWDQDTVISDSHPVFGVTVTGMIENIKARDGGRGGGVHFPHEQPKERLVSGG